MLCLGALETRGPNKQPLWFRLSSKQELDIPGLGLGSVDFWLDAFC